MQGCPAQTPEQRTQASNLCFSRHVPALTELGVRILVCQRFRKALDGFSAVLAMFGWIRNVEHRVRAALKVPDVVGVVLSRLISNFGMYYVATRQSSEVTLRGDKWLDRYDNP